MEAMNSKRMICYDCCLAAVLSLGTTIMTRVRYTGLGGPKEDNFVARFGVSSIVLFCLLFVVFLFAIHYTNEPMKTILARIALKEQRRQSRKRIIGIWAVVIVLAWIPYYLSYYPGGIFADTLGSIRYALAGDLTNRHPFFYTVLIGLSIKAANLFHRDLTWAIGFFTAVQMLVLQCEILYFMVWMLRHGVNRVVRIACSSFFVFFPLVPLYAISVWKDTPFCIAVLFWMMFAVDLYVEVIEEKVRKRTLAGFGIGMFLVAFTRNNGIYVVIFSVVVLVIIFWSRARRERSCRAAVAVGILLAIVIGVIQGPVYNIVGIQYTAKVENFGIPLQQIGAVVAYDGCITEEQKETIDRFMPREAMKNSYCPTMVDTIKWAPEFDEKYFSAHISEFLKLWLQLLKQNLAIYCKAYLMATVGFWNVDFSSGNAYVQNFVWQNEMGIAMHDYFEEWFGFSFQHFVNPRNPISNAWFFWIFFVAAWFCMKHYGARAFFLFTPQIGVWLTLMVATPIAVSLRYIASNMFTLPFVIIVPLLLERTKRTGNGEEPVTE